MEVLLQLGLLCVATIQVGDKIKVEEAEGVSAKSPSSNGQAGMIMARRGREEA